MSRLAILPFPCVMRVDPRGKVIVETRPQRPCRLRRLVIEQRREPTTLEQELEKAASDALEVASGKSGDERTALLEAARRLNEESNKLRSWGPATDLLIEQFTVGVNAQLMISHGAALASLFGGSLFGGSLDTLVPLDIPAHVGMDVRLVISNGSVNTAYDVRGNWFCEVES